MPVLPDIVDIKPANMEELTEVITAAECHPHQCNVFVYSSSKGTIRLCDMRAAALCDRHSKCKSLQRIQMFLLWGRSLPGCSEYFRYWGSIFIFFPFSFQSLRSQRTRAADLFSPRSSPPSRTWSSVTVDAIWWRVTTSPSKFGTSTWKTGQWRHIRCVTTHGMLCLFIKTFKCTSKRGGGQRVSIFRGDPWS